ncbi:hypothetical protein VU05_00250 [Desulfobulbus sp. F1]|nr:hypothetical protein [Desulfobulbus sp. F1]
MQLGLLMCVRRPLKITTGEDDESIKIGISRSVCAAARCRSTRRFCSEKVASKGRSRSGRLVCSYGNELTEGDAARGNVESWVSLQNSDRETIRTWSDSLLRQAIA